MNETARGGGLLRDPWLLSLLAGGFALRAFAVAWLDPDMQLLNDENTYAGGAAGLVLNGRLETGAFVRPPLYFLYLAFTQLLVGQDWRPLAKLGQAAIGALTVLPVYAIAQRVGGRTSARIAAGFWSLDPTLVAYTHLLWPETLFTALVAVVWAGLFGLERARPPKLLGLGVVTGLALLVKPIFGLFTLALAAAWWRQHGLRTALRLALLVGGAAALVIAPWVVRNQLRYGPTVLLENQLAYNLWVANDPAPSLEIYEEWRRLPDPVTRSRVGFERGAAAIAADPAGFASSLPGRAVKLWGLEFFVVRHMIFGAYGEVSRGAFLAAFWLIQLGWAALLLCAACGLPALWRARELRPVLVYAVALTLLVSCMLVSTRFRVPFGVPLCVAGGLGAPLVARARLSWREWTALAAALGILVLSCSRPVFRSIARAEFASPAELRNPDWMQHRY